MLYSYRFLCKQKPTANQNNLETFLWKVDSLERAKLQRATSK